MTPMAGSLNLEIEARRAGPWPRRFDGWRDVNPSGVTTGCWSRSFGRVGAVVSEMVFGGGFLVDRAHPADRLIVILDEAGDRIHGRVDGKASKPDAPHRLYHVPAGAPFFTFAERPRFLRYLSVQFEAESLEAMADGARRLPREPRLGFFEPSLLALAWLFEAECRTDRPDDPLLADSLSLGLLALLSDSRDEPQVSAYRGGLTARQMRLVTEHLESRLSQAADPAVLAGITGLSPSHFHRAFRASMGAPPHRWLLERRIRRAQELMLAQDKTLAEIAIETGFADQPHFTRTFSKVVGASPAAWRRAML
jgi:AraC-like DNA-binding protein